MSRTYRQKTTSRGKPWSISRQQAALQTDAAAKPSIRRYYVLGLLTVIYALNFLDRTIFNVLIEPIKKEFALSDTTMGLLAGFGFVLFYSVLGIPIARLADRFNRRNIVADRAGVLERDDGLLRHGAKRGDAGAGAHRRRHRRIRRHARLAVDHRRSLQQERTPARARHLRHRHLSRRIPRLFHRRLHQPVLWLADGVLYRRSARPRARRRAVADDFRTEARRDGGDVYAGADRADARLPRLATDVCHPARRLLPDDLHQLRDLGLDSAVPGAGAPSLQRRDRHLCRHLQGAVRHRRHAARRVRGGPDRPPRRSLEIMGARGHVGPRRTRCLRCAC